MQMDRDKLECLFLDAHARDDGAALVDLYTIAANQSEAAGKIDAACFYLTQAFVFGLHCGSAETRDLQMRLSDYGREIRPEDRDKE